MQGPAVGKLTRGDLPVRKYLLAGAAVFLTVSTAACHRSGTAPLPSQPRATSSSATANANPSPQVVVPLGQLDHPDGVAVDSAGGLYVADYADNGRAGRVLKVPAGSTRETVLPFTGVHGPGFLAVDSSGNIYVPDYTGNRVLKLPAS